MESPGCILCEAKNLLPIVTENPEEFYYHCALCDLRFLEPSMRLSPIDEKARYLSHNNDIHDPRYRNFVRPLFEAIRARAPLAAKGLDFGAGTGPVLAEMLKESGFDVALYDPYFWPDPLAFTRKYDFIFACEVIEHLYSPRTEIQRIRDSLKPGGFFALMTSLVTDKIDFKTWHYRRDPTHIAFYSAATFDAIQRGFGFKSVETSDDRIVVLTI